MISTPRTRRIPGAAMAFVGLLAATLASGQVYATRLSQNVDPQGGSHVSPDLQRLVLGPRAAAVQPVDNLQIVAGLPSSQMQFDGDGRVGVRVTARDVAALVPELTNLGLHITSSRPDAYLVEGFILPGALAKLDALGPHGLLGVTAIPRPRLRVGNVTSQADFVHEADRVRGTDPAINGAGFRIGVISDSYNQLGGAAAGVLSGDLPAGINVLKDGPPGSSDEGRGMAELIHDVAPGAQMAFGTAIGGEGAFAQMILDLADTSKGNCQIVVDDVGYATEPFFQDGLISQAIDAIVAQGSAYFSAAGNDADLGYESAFRMVTDAATGAKVHDFDPGPAVDTRQRVVIPSFASAQLMLQWDDPFYTPSGVDTDLSIQVFRSGTNTLLGEIDIDNVQLQAPYEIMAISNTGFSDLPVDLAFRVKSGPSPGRLKYVVWGEMTLGEYADTGSTILGHPAAKGAMAVAAVDYDDQDHPSYFTSAGPNTILFNADGSPVSNMEVRAKPDFAAIQGTNTTFFGGDADGDGFPNFYGTSAAAPHAAAIAALVWQSNPALTPGALYSRLATTADATINDPGWDKLTGAGLINAYDAVYGPAGAATFPFSDGLEGGALTQVYETRATGAGRIEVSTANGPAQGTRHVLLTTAHDGRSGRSELILHLNAAGLTGAVLSFREREFNDADQPMSASFQGAENTDGVALSVDGSNWYRIASFTGTTSTNSYQLQRYSLAAVAAAYGITLGTDTRIKFQQFGNLKTPRGGIALDDISVLNLPGVSFGSTSYTANENEGVATINVLRAGDPTVPVQVDFVTASGTATDQKDYLGTSGTLLFQTGEVSKTITVPLISDHLIEGPETVTLSLRNISTGVLLTPADVTLTIQDDQALVAPSNLTTTATGPSSVKLDWTDHSDNETEFQIERKIGVGQFTQLTTVLPQVTSYVDTGLSVNTLYTYRVRAVAGSAASSYSNLASINISPIELQSGTYTVSEDAGLVVVRVTRAGDILSTASVQLTTVDGTAMAGLDYTAQSRSVDFVKGETTKEILIPISADRLLEADETFDVVLSNPTGGTATLGDQKKATVTITNGGTLPAPSNLTVAVASATQVQLNWKDNCTNETSMDIERRAGSGGFIPLVSLVANSEAYVDTTVVAGTVYTYRVRASQGERVSNYSNEVSTAVTSLQFETAAYTVLEDDIAVTLKVTRSGDPALPVTVKFATSDGTATTAGGDYVSGGSTLVFAPGETSKTLTVNIKDDNSLEGSETFNVTLSSATGTGAVIGSPGTAVVTIADNQARLSPSSLSAAVLSGNQVQLTWTDRCGNESAFEVERRGPGGSFAKVGETGANVTTYADSGLAVNASYTYRVRAVSASGVSSYSNDASVTTLPAAPQAPGNLAAAIQEGGKVRLTWSDNSLNEASFVLERKDGNGAFALIAGLAENSTSYIDSGRLAGQTYSYRVRSANAGGESANSIVATVTLSTPPGAPTALTASPTAGTAVRLEWTAGSNSTSTKIERRTDAGFTQVGTVAQGASTFVDQGVQPNVTYTYRVIASSLVGDSEPSNTVQVSVSTLARIQVSPAKLAFGKVKSGAVKTMTFTIKNTGSGTLGGVISAISQSGASAGAFRIISGGEAFSLVRGQVRKVTVEFQADTAGAYQGGLTISSSDPNRGVTTVTLSGSAK